MPARTGYRHVCRMIGTAAIVLAATLPTPHVLCASGKHVQSPTDFGYQGKELADGTPCKIKYALSAADDSHVLTTSASGPVQGCGKGLHSILLLRTRAPQ